MIILETIAVAFSMFSAVPMPQFEWNRRNMRYALCAFPLIGVMIAMAVWGWGQLCLLLRLPEILRGAGMCLIPVVLTGGIHMDGYADTCDAAASHAGAQKRQEILKDPHIGAFALIRVCMYFIADFALWVSLPDAAPEKLIGLFCLSRMMSGLALTSFPLREGSGLARSFSEAADRNRVRAALGAGAALLSIVLIGLQAWELPAVILPVFLFYRRMCVRDFGGLSGDLAGWFLQKAELWMLAGMVLKYYLEELP